MHHNAQFCTASSRMCKTNPYRACTLPARCPRPSGALRLTGGTRRLTPQLRIEGLMHMRVVASTLAVLVGLPLLSLVSSSCDRASSAIGASAPTTNPAGSGRTSMAYVRVIDPEGKLSDPVVMPKVVRTEEEWKKRLDRKGG